MEKKLFDELVESLRQNNAMRTREELVALKLDLVVAQREIDASHNDTTRYMAIATELATDNEQLRRVLRRALKQAEHDHGVFAGDYEWVAQARQLKC